MLQGLERLRRYRVFFAVLVGAMVVLAANIFVMSAQSSAVADDGVYVDQKYLPAPFAGHIQPGPPYKIAQPFIPESTGYAYDITLFIADEADRNFSSAQIHEFPEGESQIAAEPITGGAAVLSYSEQADESGHYEAVALFPQRPELTEGKRYAVVIDPESTTVPGRSASFHHSFENADGLNTLDKEEGEWSGAFTGRLFFQLRMTQTPAEETPDQEQPDDRPGSNESDDNDTSQDKPGAPETEKPSGEVPTVVNGGV